MSVSMQLSCSGCGSLGSFTLWESTEMDNILIWEDTFFLIFGGGNLPWFRRAANDFMEMNFAAQIYLHMNKN